MARDTKSTWALWLSLAVAAGCAGADPGGAPGASAGAGAAGGPGSAGASAGAGGAVCPDDLEFFDKQLWQPLLGKKCVACHQAGGLAKGSRMVFVPASTPDALETNFQVAAALAREQVGGVAVLLARPAGQHPDGHPGGTLAPPGSDNYKALSAFVDRIAQGQCSASPAPSCTGARPGRRRLRRLTRAEYERTVRDLFSLPQDFSLALAADVVVGGFGNNADALRVSPLQADQLRKAAEQIAAAAPELPPCPGDAAACADALLSGVARRIFRRPLAADERARYGALHAAVAKEDGVAVASETVLSALLQSPHFLYRSELGEPQADGSYRLSPHELASELSYLLWGTTPDDALLDAADKGSLATPQGLSAQVDRLLADPRSGVALDDFVGQWLDLDRLSSVAKDPDTYPSFDAPLRAAMREETRRFVDQVVRVRGGSLDELLTSRSTFANEPLAALYGAPPQPWGELSLEGSPRAGLLTQASVLAVHGHPSGSSPIHRGKLVREKLLCQPLPPPPPNLNVQPPPVDPALSTRERFAAHATVEPCVSCHKLIDPVGFAFEGFDGIGRWRDAEAGKPVNTQGEIVDSVSTDGVVDGAASLAEKLAQSAEVRACFASQWLRYGYGLDEAQEIPCLSEQLRSSFAAGDGSVQGLLRALVASPHFAQRLADPGDPPPPGSAGSAGQSGGPQAGQGGSGNAGGGAGGAGGEGQGGQAPTDALLVDTKVDSEWPTGACSTVIVTNQGSDKVAWKIALDVGGTLSDVWNATATPQGSQVSFVGVSWNASIAPGATASFGFCVQK